MTIFVKLLFLIYFHSADFFILYLYFLFQTVIIILFYYWFLDYIDFYLNDSRIYLCTDSFLKIKIIFILNKTYIIVNLLNFVLINPNMNLLNI